MLIQVIGLVFAQSAAVFSLQEHEPGPCRVPSTDNSFQHQFEDAVKLLKPHRFEVSGTKGSFDQRPDTNGALSKKLLSLSLVEDRVLSEGLTRIDNMMATRLKTIVAKKSSPEAFSRDFEDRLSVLSLVLALRYQSERIDPSSYLGQFQQFHFRALNGQDVAYWPWPWIKKDETWVLAGFEYGPRTGPSSTDYKLLSLLELFREAAIPLRTRRTVELAT